MTKPDLTDEDYSDLAGLVREAITNERYFLSPRVKRLKGPSSDARSVDRIIAWTEAHHDLVIAAGTLALAVFTLALVAATLGLLIFAAIQARDMRRLARATNRSAIAAERALTELERPYLVVDVPEPGIRVDVNGNFSFAGGPQPRWEAVNYGRTPALLVDRLTLWMHEADGTMPYAIDPVTQRGPQFPAGCVAAADHPFTETHNFLADLPDAQSFIAPGAWQTRRLFFIGYVRYADLLGSVYVNGFCLRFDHLGRQFVHTGGDAYNYTRTEKTANTGAA